MNERTVYAFGIPYVKLDESRYVRAPDNWDNLSDQQRYWWIQDHRGDPMKRIEETIARLRG